jgi:transcriptional regulator with XRE-family HTH domain
MPKFKRPQLAAEAHRRNLEQLGKLGAELRTSRRRRRLTLRDLEAIAGISKSAISDIELGRGGSHTLDAWQRLAIGVGRPLVVGLERDRLQEPADAAHLAIQELVLREGRRAGFAGSFELATRPAEPWRSSDVGLRNDRHRLLVLIECWNTFGDLGAAARSSTRKTAEAEMLAVAIGGDRPYRVAACWVVRATRRNLELLRRYPEVFGARFRGSSLSWWRALTGSSDQPPVDPGLVWCDVGCTRLYPWRRG